MDNLYIKENYFKNVMSNFGKHYYYATLFFPLKIRNQVFITYAFVRRLDDIVDDKNLNLEQKKEKFNEWNLEWENLLKNKTSKFEELNFFYQIIKDKNIDINFVDSFINSMYFDLSKVRIKNYNELEKYMFGSATVVGYFMLYIFDIFNETTKKYAEKLAQAMQLTNFIRDVKEDLMLDRIYLPLEDAKKYNISEKDFFYQKFSEDFKKFIKYYVDLTQDLYIEANKGIKYLPKFAQFPVLYASNLYKSILDEIIKNKYNIFDFNYKINKIKKVFIFLKSLFQFIFKKYE